MKRNMKVPSIYGSSAALLLCSLAFLAACGGSSEEDGRMMVDGIGQKEILNKVGSYDIEITGARNEVQISAGNTVRNLLVTGLHNTIRVNKTATVLNIDLTGTGNTVYIPLGLQAKITKSGSNNDVIEVE